MAALRIPAALILLAFGLSACSSDEDEDPSHAPTPSSTVDATGSPQVEPTATQTSAEPAPEPTVILGLAPDDDIEGIAPEQERDELVEPFIAVSAEALTEPSDADLSPVVTVAEGPARDELRALIDEFDANGWSQHGAPEVVSSRVVSVEEGSPAAIVMEVCLDHSDVEIVDDAGVSQVDETAPLRALNIFTLHQTDGRWAVYERTFPVVTEC